MSKTRLNLIEFFAERVEVDGWTAEDALERVIVMLEMTDKEICEHIN